MRRGREGKKGKGSERERDKGGGVERGREGGARGREKHIIIMRDIKA